MISVQDPQPTNLQEKH